MDRATVVIDPPDPLIGRTIGGCRVLGKLGQGGMGAVYLAEQLSIKRKVALKVLHRELARDQEFVDRFQREAMLTGSLNHPRITTIFDFVRTDDGTLVILMEYLQGMPLNEVIRSDGALPVPRALRLGIQIAEGLAAAHSAGVIHRDVKPQNIYVLAPGDAVKLLDFGIARLRDARDAHLTRTGAILGTPTYMAPEQIEGRDVTEKTDIYAFGLVLYEMLTGVSPFGAPTATAVLTKQLREDPTPPRTLRPELSPRLEQVVLHALDKEPDYRPDSIADVVRQLRAVSGVTSDPEPQLLPPRPSPVPPPPTEAVSPAVPAAPSRPSAAVPAMPETAVQPPAPFAVPETMIVPASDGPPSTPPRVHARTRMIAAVIGLVFVLAAAVVGVALYITRPDATQTTVESRLQERGLLGRPGAQHGVTVQVNAGVVSLTGALASRQQRDDAIQVARGVQGVRDVDAKIRVLEPDPAAIQRTVEDRLREVGLLGKPGSGHGVTVQVNAGVVTLTGVLAEEQQRHKAIQAARGADGVRDVQAQVQLEPDSRSIQRAVEESLRKLRLLGGPDSEHGVTVQVNAGVAALTGVLVDTRQRDAAIQAARGVEGVRRVDAKIQVAALPPPPDSESIRRAVEESLRKARLLGSPGSEQGLTVQVNAAVVTLSGVLADTRQRDAAIQAARRVEGVRRVEASIRVLPPTDVAKPAPPPDPESIQRAVENRLREQGLLRAPGSDERGVRVNVAAGVVTLTGVLADREQRERAIRTALSVPGVRRVEPKINLPWGSS